MGFCGFLLAGGRARRRADSRERAGSKHRPSSGQAQPRRKASGRGRGEAATGLRGRRNPRRSGARWAVRVGQAPARLPWNPPPELENPRDRDHDPSPVVGSVPALRLDRRRTRVRARRRRRHRAGQEAGQEEAGLRPRGRREARREARPLTVQGPARGGARVAARDQLRPVARHPLPARARRSGATRSSPFEVQFFHPGLYYDRTVRGPRRRRARACSRSRSRRTTSTTARTTSRSRVPQDLGFAGFRVHYPIKTPRLPGRGDRLPRRQLLPRRRQGPRLRPLGARRSPSTPRCRRARSSRSSASSGWCARRPAPRSSTFYALLDSPRVTGAYRFVVIPGDADDAWTSRARLFLRETVEKLGIAPLTSMFFCGENNACRTEDYRPEVHDSDGLLLDDSHRRVDVAAARQPARALGELVPHAEPARLRPAPARPRLRPLPGPRDAPWRRGPSVWVEPKGDWGPGRVELVEIPTEGDINDNIVVVLGAGRAGRARQVDRLRLAHDAGTATKPSRPPGGRVVATRRDLGTFEDGQRFVIDFAGKELRGAARARPCCEAWSSTARTRRRAARAAGGEEPGQRAAGG